jgi:hypothetical protein
MFDNDCDKPESQTHLNCNSHKKLNATEKTRKCSIKKN